MGSAEADQEVTAQNKAGGETEEGDLSAAGVTEAKNSHDYRPAQRSHAPKSGTVPDEASVPLKAFKVGTALLTRRSSHSYYAEKCRGSQPGVNLPPEDHSAMFRDNFGCHNLGGGVATGI